MLDREGEKQWMDKPIVYLLQRQILNGRLQCQNSPVTKTTMQAIYIDHLHASFLNSWGRKSISIKVMKVW